MQFRPRSIAALAALALLILTPVASLAQPADLAPYEQDFELLDQTSTTALGGDGWVVYANVFSFPDTTRIYGYGTFPAPNDPLAPAFSLIDILQGGTEQGLQQLVVISDYNNVDHLIPNLIESNVFQERLITQANVGQTWTFQFDAKRGDIAGNTTAQAFIKTIDPLNNFWATNNIQLDMTSIPETWGTFTIELDIISDLVGQYFQFGFSNLCTNYEPSAIFYDNVFVSGETGTDAPANSSIRRIELAQNYPNPFNPSTQIDFRLVEPGNVDLAVYDLAGRRIATLWQGNLAEGDHSVQWNGRADDGAAVASGNYLYRLRTSAGTASRTMTLLK